MRIVLITFLALLIIWMVIFDIKLNNDSEEMMDFTGRIEKSISFSKNDNVQISIYYFEKCSLDTLDYIFKNIELKESMGNRVSLILFLKDEESIILADPHIEKTLGELQIDYLEKTLSEGIVLKNEAKTLNEVVGILEKELKRVSKTALKLDYGLRRLKPSEINLNHSANLLGPLDSIEESLK